MVDIQFRISEQDTKNTLAIEFGPRVKCSIVSDGIPSPSNPVVNIVNTVYRISEQKRKIIEQESKGVISVPTGIYTRLEIETSNLMFQAEEIPTEFDNLIHVEKAYQNLMDNIITKFPEFTEERQDVSILESFLVLLSIPFVQNEDEYTEIIQIHLSSLKSLGFKNISFLNQIASSFYSQRDKIAQDNFKDRPMGILLNIGKSSQIGIMDSKILPEGFLDINLGTSMVLEHSQAILRDLSIHGIKQDTIVQWLISDGRVDGKAPFTTKAIRRKEINVTSILNSPKLLFDYKGTTRGLENDPNSVIDGIIKALTLTKDQTDSILPQLLKTIVVTGPGAFFKGIDVKIKSELEKSFPENEINVIIGEDPLNSVSNGLLKYLKIYQKLKAFNVVFDEKEILLEKIEEDKVESTIEILSSIKNHLHNLDQLLVVSEKYAKIVENLPENAKSMLNIKLLQESKHWTLQLNNILNPLLKDAKKSLNATEEVADIFRTVGIQISKLPKFIRPTLAKVFTTNFQHLKTIKGIHLENAKKKTVDVLHNANLQIREEFTLQELMNATNFDKEQIMELLDQYLEAYPNLGYTNETFIKFNQEKLIQAEKILDLVTDKYFDSLNKNLQEKIDHFSNQGKEYCKFLIKGYEFLQNESKSNQFKEDITIFENMISMKSKSFFL